MFHGRASKHPITRPESEDTTESINPEQSFEEEGSDTQGVPLKSVLSRTSTILLDYKQFLAARRIQAFWRGFHYRRMRDLREKAAITIQRWWRGFYVRNNYYNQIENMLQERIVAHYNESATKIQALFRGWWTRQTVHDVHNLKRLQYCAAEDLLQCVAFKLHHLLRTYSIPGVYSLRNSHCLSRVEKLLASMKFRFHNDRVRASRLARSNDVEQQRRNFKDSRFQTKVPYGGPNFGGGCKPSCEENLRMSKDMDRRMHQILAEYEASQREQHAKFMRLSLAERKRRRLLDDILSRQEKNKRDFCGDVIASMQKWKVLDDKKYAINKDIFRTPEKLEQFLNEISDILNDLEGAPCHCKIKIFNDVICH